MIQIPDANYVPDLDTARIPGSITSMSGFAPLQRGYYGSASKNTVISGVDTDVTRVQTFRQTDGTVRLIFFRDTDIEEYSGSWTTRGSGFNSASKWDAAAWGNRIIAVNYLDAIQTSTGGNFSALSGSPPKARYVAANVNFVMLADTNDVNTLDDGAAYPDMVWWSALQDPTDFDPDIATQAGNNRLLDTPGPIKRLVAFRDKFIAFKSNSIFIGEYIGPPYVFGWRLLSSRVGLSGSSAVVELDDRLYFAHESGVFEYDGSAMRNIGLPVWHSIMNTFGYTTITSGAAVGGVPSPGSGYQSTSITRMQMAADDIEGVVWLSCYTERVLDGTLRMYLFGYNARAGKWGQMGLVVTSADAYPVLATTTHSDMRTFLDGLSLGDEQARLWFADNDSGILADIRYPDAWTADIAGTVMTGLQGTVDGSSTVTRVYTRSMEGSSDAPFGTCVLYGYANEQRTLGAQSKSCTANTELESWDGQQNARFQQAYLTGTTGKRCILAGVGMEYLPQGRR